MKSLSDLTNWRFSVSVIVVGMFLFGCSTTSLLGGSKLPGSSAADMMLQRNTMQAITIYENVADADCQDWRVANTEITAYPEDPGKSAWKERWTVDRCGESAYYDITYTPTPERGGTNYSIKPIGNE